jgi:hypothetical protein
MVEDSVMTKGNIEQTGTVLVSAWSSWGAVDEDVLTHLISPELMGGPRWPGRQAYRVARAAGQLLLASDGLSTHYEEGTPKAVNGLGHEFYAMTGDAIATLPGSWLWNMVWEISNFAAKRGDLRELLDEMGTLSTELYDVSIPNEHADRFVNESERVGVLLGAEDGKIPSLVEGPCSSIRLVNVKLLTIDETEFAAEGGEEGRAELVERLVKQGAPTVSSLERPSVA